MKKTLKNKQGITLVALVVTVIVLLILAGVTITSLLGDDGIIQKAQQAANTMNEAIEIEQAKINDLQEQLNNVVNEDQNTQQSTEISIVFLVLEDTPTIKVDTTADLTWKEWIDGGYWEETLSTLENMTYPFDTLTWHYNSSYVFCRTDRSGWTLASNGDTAVEVPPDTKMNEQAVWYICGE